MSNLIMLHISLWMDTLTFRIQKNCDYIVLKSFNEFSGCFLKFWVIIAVKTQKISKFFSFCIALLFWRNITLLT